MKNQKLTIKIFAYVAMLSGSLWLGAYLVRMLICYQLFDVDLNLLSVYNEMNLEGILLIISPAFNATFMLYIIFIVSFSFFFLISKIKLKENGWFFIIIIIIYSTLPFEAFLMITDFKLISILNFNEIINTEYTISLIRDRFNMLNGFPFIIILSYCSIIFFLIFQPFTINAKNEN